MPSSSAPINRTLTGILSLLCLGCGVLVSYVAPHDNLWCGSFIRTGLVLGALWLALPTKGRAAAWANVSPWWFVALTGALIVLVRRPLILLPIIVIMILVMVFLPPKRRSPS